MFVRFPFFPLLAVALLVALAGGCKDSGTEPQPAASDTSGGPIFRKPNVYLYPATRQRISVQLAFPYGGRILESVPPCGSGWSVDVEPSGLINGTYRYLFYEAQTADRYQYAEGWVVQRDSLTDFFTHVLQEVGFTESEIKDFIDYWPPLLSAQDRYEIYPQDRQQLDALLPIIVFPSPESIVRLAFVIQPAKAAAPNLAEPHLEKVTRRGFVLAEWGVILR